MTRKQRKFVSEYFVDLNATQAAIRSGYSETSARQMAHVLMTKVDVKEAVDARMSECDLSPARTLKEIGRLAYSNIADCFDESGNLLSVADMPDHAKRAIASVKVVKRNLVAGDGQMDEVYEVKQWDKVKALEMAAKYHGLLADKIEHDVQIQVSWQQPTQVSDGASKDAGSSVEVRDITPLQVDRKDST